MEARARWPRILCLAGTVAMLAGCLDPLEGSLLIMPGSGLVALGAFLGESRLRKVAVWAFGVTAMGVGVLFLLTLLGGVGGETGRSLWWLVTLLPYPVGAVLAVFTGFRVAVELSRRGGAGGPGARKPAVTS